MAYAPSYDELESSLPDAGGAAGRAAAEAAVGGSAGEGEDNMKRDLNLVRMILLDIESCPPGTPIREFTFEGRSQPEILEHVALLLDADFIEGVMAKNGVGMPAACLVRRMTWTGQEFLAKAKNDTIWKKVIAQAEEKGMSTSMTIVNGLLEAAAKKYAGLDT